MKYYAAKDKDGTIHISNCNFSTENKYSWFPILSQQFGNGWCFTYYNNIEGLTFENSPQEIEVKIKI